MPQKFKSQSGAIPMLVLLAALGIIGFILASNTIDFKDPSFQALFPKPASHAATALSTNYSVTLNQQSLHFGDSVNFTMVFPKEADRKVGRQQMNNPDVDMSCYQNNIRIFQAITTDVSKTNNGDGTLTGISGFITLAGGGNGMIWTSGAATCYATLYYFGHDEQIHVLAEQRDIYVAP